MLVKRRTYSSVAHPLLSFPFLRSQAMALYTVCSVVGNRERETEIFFKTLSSWDLVMYFQIHNFSLDLFLILFDVAA